MTTINKAHNAPILLEELQNGFGDIPSINCHAGTTVTFDDSVYTTQEIVDITAIINAHDENTLTEEQQIAEAAAIAIQQGKDYLRKQYLNSSPNLSTIYNTLSNAVGNNTYLQQIMDNQIAVYQLETGYDLSSITTNADRARYVECVRRVIALLT